MPTYAFTCPHCGHRFEKRLSFSADHDHFVCPQCGTGAQRVFSPPIVFYKGRGFYTTDNHPKGKAASSK